VPLSSAGGATGPGTGDSVLTAPASSRTDLFVEAAHTVVPPLRPEFKAFDELDPAPTPGEFFTIVGNSLKDTIPRLLGSPAGILYVIRSGGRREKKQRRIGHTADYGALMSVREAAADTKWQRYFQKFDDARYVKVVERTVRGPRGPVRWPGPASGCRFQ